MLPSPSETERVILQALAALPSEDCPLMHAHGRVLRAPIRADRAMPPFDRVTMDGYAVRAAAIREGARNLRVLGLQAAGMRPQVLAEDDTCIEIATGAVLPTGADAVVPYEETNRGAMPGAGADPDGGAARRVMIAADAEVSPGRNVHRRGSDAAAGDVLVPAGVRLGGGEIAVAAACGAAHVSVAGRPSVAVVATGDELVEVDAADLAPHQIRKSNDYALRAALLLSERVARVERLHLRDLRSEIESGLRRILAEFDVVLLTGGVSKGKFDFLPQVLTELGVRALLQGVAQRPGKPMWFGVSPRRTPVFALPGNPVSAYTCLHRYVVPALDVMAGLQPAPLETAVLAERVTFKPSLTYFLPVALQPSADGRHLVAPAPFNTSGDLGGLVGTHGFVELPAEQQEFLPGTVARFWRWL
jgi:molybdopterin molybdotransferase